MFKRVLIKVSGEALGNDDGRGLNNEKLQKVADQIAKLSEQNIECVVVIGAGNFWRGKYGYEYIERTTSDHMGMLATVLNGLALQACLEAKGKNVRMQTAIEMKEVAEMYIRRKAIRHLEKGRIVILGCGTGNPYFTTDTAAAQRALELDCDAILLAKNIDGVYDKDPREYNDAKKYNELTYMQVINEGLKVMDATAITLCMENNVPILVFALNEENSLIRAVNGENLGTIIQ